MNIISRHLPLIKENRLDKIKASLRCIADYPYDRKGQRECIMGLYPGKTEKSVFRGMIIPSLRHLGLIIGYAGALRISADARIIMDSESIDASLNKQCIRAVMYEVDKRQFGLIESFLKNAPLLIADLIHQFTLADSPTYNSVRERVTSWLSILEQVELIDNDNQRLTVNESNYRQVKHDLDTRNISIELFTTILFTLYNDLGKETAGIVDIADLRASMASKMLMEKHKIVTERVFDDLLRSIPFLTESYIISLGRPMGAEEKLFKYENDYYRTISIDRLRG